MRNVALFVIILLVVGCTGAEHDRPSAPMETQLSPTSGSARGNLVDDLSSASGQRPGSSSRPLSDQTETGRQWLFWPTRVRVHPLSRAIRAATDRSLILEVRLEFLDRFGHNSKGVGQVRLELYHSGPGRGNARPEARMRLGVWTIDISSAEQNLLHYDDVTRTYLFRLEVEDGLELSAEGEIIATVLTGRKRLTDTYIMSFR